MIRKIIGFKIWIILGLVNLILLAVMIFLINKMIYQCNQFKKTCVLYAPNDNHCSLTINTEYSTTTCSPFECDLKENEQKDVDCYHRDNNKCPSLECYDKFTVGYIAFIFFMILGELCGGVVWYV